MCRRGRGGNSYATSERKEWSVHIFSHLDPRWAAQRLPRVTFSHDLTVGRKQREVSRAEAEQFAKEEGLLFLEASAKTGENVDRVRRTVCRLL